MKRGPIGNPYVGLRPFFTADSRIFFGRDEQVSELMRILHAHRFLPVVGGSGSGKSSLVRAGLIPKLRAGFLVGDRDRWQIVTLRPGGAPILNLATELAEGLGAGDHVHGDDGLDAALRIGLAGAALAFIEQHLASNASLLILVDQFEELFAFRGSIADDEAETAPSDTREWRRAAVGDATLRARRRAEAADFVDILLGLAARRDLPVFVALTMRSDFLGDCDVFQGLPEAMNAASYLVPRLTREQLRVTIEGPALMAGADMSERLLDRLLNDLGDRSDRLPVLQHALHRTFEAWQNAGRAGPIDLRHFEAAGGLEHALEQDAELALASVDAKAAEGVFRALTDTDISMRRVRRPGRVNELARTASVEREQVDQVVAAFRGNDRNFLFVSADGDAQNPRVDISHESLIRQWPRLSQWVDAERRAGTRFRRLVATARLHLAGERELMSEREFAVQSRTWDEIGATPAWAARYSARPDDFAVAQAFVTDSAAALEAARVEAARREAEAARTRARVRRARIVGLVAIVVMLSGALFVVNRQARMRRQVIADAGAVVGFMTRINAALDTIEGTGDVRRELRETADGLTRSLSTGAGQGVTVAGTEFWRALQVGDGARQRAHADSARVAYDRARDIAARELLASPTNRVWRRNATIALVSLAQLERGTGRPQVLRTLLEQSLAARERLADEDARDPLAQHDVAVALVQMGDMLRDEGDFAGARPLYAKAVVVSERQARDAPESRERQWDVFARYESRGRLELDAGQPDSARSWYEKARDLADRLAAADPDDPQGARQRSHAYAMLGDIERATGNGPGARELYTKALTIAENLAADPGGYLTLGYTRLGDLEAQRGDRRAARAWYLKAVALEERLARSDTSNVVRQRNVALSYNRLGELELPDGDLTTAREWLTKGLEAMERRARLNVGSAEAQHDLWIRYVLLGEAAESARNAALAEQWYTKALGVVEPLGSAGASAAAHDLFITYRNLGDVTRGAANRATARGWYTKALAVAERLLQAVPGSARAADDVASCRSALRELGGTGAK